MVYAGGRPWTGRWRVQLPVALVFTAAVVSGALVGCLEQRAWVVVPCAAAWAAGTAAWSDRTGLAPPGPMLPLFAFGASAARPTQLTEVPAALAVAVGTAALGLGLGLVQEALARRRGIEGGLPSAPPVDPERARLHVVRVAAVVALSGSLATAIGIGHPYWAMVAAVVPLSVPRLRNQALRALHRGIGTLAGVGVAYELLSLQLPPLAAVLVAAGLQAGAELLVVRHYGAAMIVITPLALLMGHLATASPVGQLVTDRFVETCIGLAVGVAAAWLTRARTSASHPANSR